MGKVLRREKENGLKKLIFDLNNMQLNHGKY